jgi:hypothetical protein
MVLGTDSDSVLPNIKPVRILPHYVTVIGTPASTSFVPPRTGQSV